MIRGLVLAAGLGLVGCAGAPPPTETRECRFVARVNGERDLEAEPIRGDLPLVLVGRAAYWCPCDGPRAVGGGGEARGAGGAGEGRRVAGAGSGRALGGAGESRSGAGSGEGRAGSGAGEGRALGGAGESRGGAGAGEGRAGAGAGEGRGAGGAGEGRALGGAGPRLTCQPQSCGGYALWPVRGEVRIYDGESLRTSDAACVL